MLVLGAMIKHFWQQIYEKRSNFVIANLQVLNFALGFSIHVITAFSTPADMQSCLNSESKTLDLMEAKEEKLFNAYQWYLSHLSLGLYHIPK